jgi:hypothetical protein
MFDHLAWRQECSERYLLTLDDDELDDEEFWTDTDERYEAQIDDADPRF